MIICYNIKKNFSYLTLRDKLQQVRTNKLVVFFDFLQSRNYNEFLYRIKILQYSQIK